MGYVREQATFSRGGEAGWRGAGAARTGYAGAVRDANHHNTVTVVHEIGVLARQVVLALGWVR